MNYVQMHLKEMEAPKLKGDVYVHQCELIVIDHQKIDTRRCFKTFNDKHETTKFVFDKSFKTITDSNGCPQVDIQVVQLGDETPFLHEVIAFLSDWGMELLNVSCRSYLATDLPDTIESGEDGLSDFLNEIFCLEEGDGYYLSKSSKPFDLFKTAHRYQPLLSQLGLTIKAFETYAFNATGRFQHLQLRETNGARCHNFEASFWVSSGDDDYDYYISERVETSEFENGCKRYCEKLLNLVEKIEGDQSFDEFYAELHPNKTVLSKDEFNNHSQVTSTFLNVMEPTPTENDDDLPF